MITALTNTNALNAQNILTSLQAQDIQNMQQLSTGQQLNSAADNPAALAISQRLQEQSTGNSQAIKNIQEGLSMIQTADGGLSNIQAILQKMQSLVIEAQNTTLSSSDVSSLQKEYNALTNTLNQISINTKYNGIPLLDNASGIQFNGINSLASVSNSASLNSVTSQITVEVKFNAQKPSSTSANILTKFAGTFFPQTYAYGPYWLEMYNNGDVVFWTHAQGTPSAHSPAGVHISFNQTNDAVFTFNTITGVGQTFLNGNLVGTSTSNPTGPYLDPSTGPLVFGSGEGNLYGNTGLYMNGVLSTVRIYNQTLNSQQVKNNYNGQITQNGLVGDWLLNEDQGTNVMDNSGNGNSGTLQNGSWVTTPVNLQIGNKSSSTYALSLPSISSNGLGLTGLQVNSPLALSFLHDALNVVVGQRESLGSQQVSLQAQMANLQSSIVMTKSANSQIKDANMTQQMSELTKNQVQQQMSLSMLNTANQSPKILFKLLS